jgi:hypothetical protein
MGVGVAGLWLLVPGLAGTFRTLFATLAGDTSTTSRTSAFSTAMPYISQHPWFGHGFGTFFPATYFFTDDQYLLSLIEIGAVGLFALLALFVTGLVTAQRVRRMTKDPEMRDLGQSLTATIAVAMVAFGTFDALSFNMAAGLTFLFLGCTGAALRLLRAQGAQADGQLASQLVTRPGQEPPALTHRPAPDGPGVTGAAGAVSGLAGLRAGQQTNGGQQANGQPNVPPKVPDEFQPDEKPSEQQAKGHLPAPAEQLEQPTRPPREEHVEAQMEKLADSHLGERGDRQPERQAEEGPSEPGEAGPQEPAGVGPEETAQAQVKQPAQPPWENQLSPWEPQDLPARPHQEGQLHEGRQEKQTDEEGQEEGPAEAHHEQPARAEPTEAQADQPAPQTEQPAAQSEQPEAPPGLPAEQVGRPEALPGLPAEQAEQPAAQPEQPAQAPWDPWRKADRPTAPSAAAEQAASDQRPAEPSGSSAAEVPGQQAPEPAAQPTPEPPAESPEESTIPIPIIRD